MYTVMSTITRDSISASLCNLYEVTPWLYVTLAIIFALLVLEQTTYHLKKRHLPGSAWTIPLFGHFAHTFNPTMEEYLATWNTGPLTGFGSFIVMASSTNESRKILNSSEFTEPCLVHAAKRILLSENWIFLTGKRHLEYRRSLASLFTRKALSIYAGIFDTVSREHFSEWLCEFKKDPSPRPIQMIVRNLTMDTALRVFCGTYIDIPAAKEITDQYWNITLALKLVNFPFPFPGTRLYKAIQARKCLFNHLETVVEKSKTYLAAGNEPACLVDEWVETVLTPGKKEGRGFTNHELSMVIFSFLFASQDAMTSALVWGLQHLADHPEVLDKVREEQARIRGGDYTKPTTVDMLDDMSYLRAVVRESLRLRPPALMIPYKATQAFPLTNDYIVPKGSIIIPTFYNALHDPHVYPNPDSFDPERWLEEYGSANANLKNYLVFGAGPHRCLGEQYTMMNLTLVLGTAAIMMDWKHVRTPDSDRVKILATIYPKDGCILSISHYHA